MQVEGQHGISVLVATGGRVRNAYATCLMQGDSPWKRGLIPDVDGHRMVSYPKVRCPGMGSRPISLLAG